MTKKLLLLVALLALILMAACPVQAVNVSFSSIDGAADRDMYLYQGGVLVGLYNTSSTGIEITTDTSFVFRPQTRDVLEDPGDWLTGVAFPWVKSNFVGLIAVAILLAILARRFL